MTLLALVPNATLFATYATGVAVSVIQALPLVRRPAVADRGDGGPVRRNRHGIGARGRCRFPLVCHDDSRRIVVIGIVAARGSDRTVAVCLAAIVATAAVAPIRHHMPLGYFTAGALAGAVFVLVIRLIVHLRETSARLQAERRLRAVDEVRKEAAAQRSALSAQVHDIVGHHLAAISLTASSEAGRASSGAEKNHALSDIATSAALALSEIRSVLDETSLHPGPATEADPASLAQFLAGWEDVGVHINHSGVSIIDAADPALRHEAYLVTRQAITNAVQHGRTKSVRLIVADEGAVLRLTIANDADQGDVVLGRGLTSMRTRLAKHGHDLAIRTGDGVFELDVTLVKET
ncbi:hypothetical protein SAMN04489793_5386 [Tsukamurella tyrosinosolvens]|uniref:Uncharacterized protein n=2 Tax=Tsukamurella tyrosinosolvens TaxID=57704 RepID=A0A1H5CDH7_TSUTY|nr:hypothetical protein SAMN04489793_5386 [Tsukamurella tyrosinosolvens]